MATFYDADLARTHEAVWSVIDRIARENAFSTSGLAVEVGLDKTSFNKSKRCAGSHLRWPTAGTIALILVRTGTTFADFGRMTDEAVADLRRRQTRRAA